MIKKKQLEVECPKCKLKFNYYDSNFRPFCTERCREIDLGHWVSGNYKVPSKEKLNEEDMDRVIEEIEKGSHEL